MKAPRMPLRAKALLLGLGALGAAASLTACGGGTSSAAGNGDGKYVYVAGSLPDGAYEAIGCGFKEEAPKLGVTAEVQGPREFTPQAQIPILEAAVNGGAEGIAISPNDAKALFAPIDKASSSIPVVTALNTLEDSDPLTAEVVADEVEGGRDAVKFLAEQAGGKSGKVAVISFKPGASVPTDLRLEGIEDELKEYPNLEYVGAQYVNEVEPQPATVKANAILAKDPDLMGLIVTFGVAGEGAATALRQHHAENVIAVTYDITIEGVKKDLESGELSGVVDYDQNKIGATALEDAVKANEGEKVSPKTALPPITFTKADLAHPEDLPSPDC
jgi:ribose transport system substrate-binding protein